MIIPVASLFANVALATGAPLNSGLSTNIVVPPLLLPTLWAMCSWNGRSENRESSIVSRPICTQVLRKLQLERKMSHWFLQETKTKVTVDNPHVVNRCIEQVKKRRCHHLWLRGRHE
jgi:hypothetical protein